MCSKWVHFSLVNFGGLFRVMIDGWFLDIDERENTCMLVCEGRKGKLNAPR